MKILRRVYVGRPSRLRLSEVIDHFFSLVNSTHTGRQKGQRLRKINSPLLHVLSSDWRCTEQPGAGMGVRPPPSGHL